MKLLRRLAPYFTPYWAWLPLLFVCVIMLLYLVACLPPGKRFIYPLGRIFGGSVVSDAIFVNLSVWEIFGFTCVILALIPLLAHTYKFSKWAVYIFAVLLVFGCYLPYFFLLLMFYDETRWREISTIQTPHHRIYLADKYYDSGGLAAMLFLCDEHGWICELVGDDLLRTALGEVIENHRPPLELSLELDGNDINVLNADGTVVYIMPIP